MYDSLRALIKQLESEGDLSRIRTPVSPVLEMTEIQTRLLRNGGPAVLFENVQSGDRRYDMPVLVNLFGTKKRVAQAMGTTEDGLRAVGETLAFLRQPDPPRSLKEAFRMAPLVRDLMAMRPRHTRRAPCQEKVLTGNDIDLTRLPVQTCWPGEPAPLITWPLVVSEGPAPDTDRRDRANLGIYRMQVLNTRQTCMRWLKHRGGAQQFARWVKARGEPFPVAAVLGADPGVTLAAVTPIPDTISEYQFAGLLRHRPVHLVPCKTVPLMVPATAEIVIEGHVSAADTAPEGPYGDHTGYYNAVEPFPVFTASAITMRQDPIYLSTFTGRPPDEPSVLGEALNELFVPLLTQQFPEIVDFWLPPEGCSYRIAVVSMKKAYAGHAKRVIMGVWSFLRQFMYTKFVFVVDDDINARDWKDVMWAISTRMDPVRDIVTVENTPIDYLDFASPVSGLGGKLAFDATNKWPGETGRDWGMPIRMEQSIVDLVSSRWNDYGLPGDGQPIWPPNQT